jgi:hypothetical protein
MKENKKLYLMPRKKIPISVAKNKILPTIPKAGKKELKTTKTIKLPHHKVVIKNLTRMNPNRVRERSFIISADTKEILYITVHFIGKIFKTFHTVNICTNKKRRIEYENNGSIVKDDDPIKEKQKKQKVIKKAQKIADVFFTTYATIENDQVVSLVKEKIGRNKHISPQSKLVKTRKIELERALLFVNNIIEIKKKEKQRSEG